MERPCTDVRLTAEQNADLQALADALGVAPEMAVDLAIKAALDAQCLLPNKTSGSVVCPIRPETGPASWERIL